jgi:hypothetical protein
VIAMTKIGLGRTLKRIKKPSAEESLGLYEVKQHKPWCDEECLLFLDRSKQAKKQCIQNPNQNNVDNLHNVRCEASRHFRNNRRNI